MGPRPEPVRPCRRNRDRASILFFRGPFSQFHASSFTVGDHDYVCAEQYMHAEKARLFGDIAMAERIMKSEAPTSTS